MQLYYAQHLSDANTEAARLLGFERVITVPAGCRFAPQGDLDEDQLRLWLSGPKHCGTDFSGHIMLDLEGWNDWMRKDPRSDKFDHAERQLVRAAEVAKDTCPDARVGHWHQPLNHYLTGPAARPYRLLDSVDWICPAPYWWVDKQEWTEQRYFTHDEVHLAQVWGNGKLVIPCIWHRHGPLSKVQKYKGQHYDLIDDFLFRDMLWQIKNLDADGVIWWSGDNHLFDVASSPEPEPGTDKHKKWKRVQDVLADEQDGRSLEDWRDATALKVLTQIAGTSAMAARKEGGDG